jgi:hypothetical protein
MRSKVFLVLSIVFTINIIAQDVFEGVVKYKMVNDGQEMFMNYYTNGVDIKVDIMGEEEASMIMKGDKMIMLMPNQNMYMEFPASMLDMAQQMSPDSEADESGFDPKEFEKYRTGETKKIHGFNCEKWFFDSEEGTSEIWMTDEIGNFNFLQNPLQGGNYLFNQFSGLSYFPIMMIVKDKESNEVTSFEATEIKEMSLNDSEFNVPSGYQKMDMGGMMKMFQKK